MSLKVRLAINLVQELAALDPKRERPTIRQLAVLLKIRKDPLVFETAAELKEIASQMASNPEYQTASQALFKEAEILSVFIDLSDEEAENLGKYLKSLDLKPDSLAKFLAEKLGAEIQDRYNLDKFSDPRMKNFILNQALRNVDYQEDFQLVIKAPVSDKIVFDLIKDFYLSRGFQLAMEPGPNQFLGLMFRKGEEILFVNATLIDNLMVTVFSYD